MISKGPAKIRKPKNIKCERQGCPGKYGSANALRNHKKKNHKSFDHQKWRKNKLSEFSPNNKCSMQKTSDINVPIKNFKLNAIIGQTAWKICQQYCSNKNDKDQTRKKPIIQTIDIQQKKDIKQAQNKKKNVNQEILKLKSKYQIRFISQYLKDNLHLQTFQEKNQSFNIINDLTKNFSDSFAAKIQISLQIICLLQQDTSLLINSPQNENIKHLLQRALNNIWENLPKTQEIVSKYYKRWKKYRFGKIYERYSSKKQRLQISQSESQSK